MTTLITADTHLTDHPRDGHRWDLFPWLAKKAKKYKCDQVLILGDLTDAKDRHSSSLVNRVVRALRSVAEVCPVFVLKGNHDFIDERQPFFGFLEDIPGLTFITEPLVTELRINDVASDLVLFVPAQRKWSDALGDYDFTSFNYIFTHQTYNGAVTETGHVLEGVPAAVFNKCAAKIWSGDIHVPQRIGKRIEYVGAPYRIRFGDDYTPRVVLLAGGEERNLFFPTTEKHLVVVESVAELKAFGVQIAEGSQVKVRVKLSPSQFTDWRIMREEIEKLAAEFGWHLFGPELVAKEQPSTASRPRLKQKRRSSEDVVRDFAEAQGVDDVLLAAGLGILDGAWG